MNDWFEWNGKRCTEYGIHVSEQPPLTLSLIHISMCIRDRTPTVTTPVLALGATAIKASLDFESTFTSVRKTVDATEAEFDALAASSKAMSTNKNIAM